MRAVFVIDPKNAVRPSSIIRCRLAAALTRLCASWMPLQIADANACSTPANWLPGDEVIVPAPATQADAEKRVAA